MGSKFIGLVAAVVLCSSVSAFAQSPECTRGEPERVFQANNPAVQSVSFKPMSSHEATEEVIFKSGDRVAIHNWGCDAFTLTFRWQSQTLAAGNPFLQAVQILRKLAAMKAAAVFDLSRAANGLEALIKRGMVLKPGEMYPVDGSADDPDFQLKFSVRGFGDGYVEFDLTMGPL